MYKKNKGKIIFITFSLILLLGISGCSGKPEVEMETKTEAKTETSIEKDMSQISFDLYEKAVQESKTDDLEVVRSIVHRFTEYGYPSIDSKNQIDMTNKEQVIQFCEQVQAKLEAKLTVIEINYLGGFAVYDLQTTDGIVNVIKSYYNYENGKIHNVLTNSYDASYWKYTDDGYLLFSGECFSEESYVLTLSETEEHTAFRVQPLEEKLRELNRKYILPIAYAQNNMFLVDWSEEDFGKLNFYDLFDLFYYNIYGKYVPYAADDNLEVGAIYRIPKEEFESVIMTKFKISSEMLQAKTSYDLNNSTYEYKPRGFYEAEFPEYPYPEVVHYMENEDGTITLTVNAVYPYADISKVYTHQVVVRPLADGGVQYVSNRIIEGENNFEEMWYTPRLTEEEWTEIYGEGKKVFIEEMEREEAKADCEKVMQLMSDLYAKADKGQASNIVLSNETVLRLQQEIKETGLPVGSSVMYSNLENYEKADQFLKACMEGKSGELVMYEVHFDGGLRRMKFIFDGTDMYIYSASTSWDEKNKPIISHTSYMKMKEWNYTGKGWFCYELCVPEPPEVSEVINGYHMIRIKPMTQEQRLMSEKCVGPIGYQGNNLLCSDWDINHLDQLDYNGMYEYLYGMKYQKDFNAKEYSQGIPKAEFEKLIMEYLPITAEQIRKYAVFDEENQTYAWEQLGCFNYTPTFFATSMPEVTAVKENKDGTHTLTVDAVCDMGMSNDAVITHELTVRFAKDGSFQYLGNKIEKADSVDIPEYEFRLRIPILFVPNI